MTYIDELYSFLGVDSKNILKKTVYKECAKKCVSITAGTHLFCYYFMSKKLNLWLVLQIIPKSPIFFPQCSVVEDNSTVCKNWQSFAQICTVKLRAVHRGAFCQFSFRLIYYCHSSKSAGKKTGKTHLCAVW